MFGPSLIRFLVVFLWHLVVLITVYMTGYYDNLGAVFLVMVYGMYFHNGLSRFINKSVRYDVITANQLFSIFFFTFVYTFMADYYYIQEIFFYENLVYILFLTPIAALVLLVFIPSENINLVRIVSLIFFLFIFILSVFLYIDFLSNQYIYDHRFRCNLLPPLFLNIQYLVSIDGLSIWFILLTTLLFPLVALVSWESIQKHYKLFFMLLFLLEFFLLNIFCAEEIFVFYLYFEASAIPMFLLIGLWGSTERRIYASFKFFFYTLIGSILMFALLVFFYYYFGTTNLFYLSTYRFAFYLQIFFFIAFFSSFAVKIPMMPVHLWLPEAHVEAPTGISVLLAGILLKTGGYALIRFVLPLCPDATVFFSPFVYILSIVSIIYGSFAAIVQTDLKKMIAYSSVAHMNLATIGIFSGSVAGLQGALYLMLTHGIVSSGLFICVGIIYDRYHTRIIRYYGGLVNFMPWFAFFFLLLTLANISFPSTGSFIAEFILLSDIFAKNVVVAFLAGLGIILGAVYTVWLYNRIMFGYVNLSIRYYADLNFREYFVLLVLIFFTFFMGIYPSFFLSIATDKLIFINQSFLVQFY